MKILIIILIIVLLYIALFGIYRICLQPPRFKRNHEIIICNLTQEEAEELCKLIENGDFPIKNNL